MYKIIVLFFCLLFTNILIAEDSSFADNSKEILRIHDVVVSDINKELKPNTYLQQHVVDMIASLVNQTTILSISAGYDEQKAYRENCDQLMKMIDYYYKLKEKNR